MRMRPVLVLASMVIGACSTYGTGSSPAPAPQASESDGGGGDGGAPVVEPGETGTDAAAPDVRCNLGQPFGTPIALAELNTSDLDDANASLTDDELSIFFDRGKSTFRVFSATRRSRTDAFGSPAALEALDTTGADYQPAVTGDGSLLFYSSRSDVLNQQIFLSERRDGAYGAGVLVASLKSTGTDTVPTLVGAGNEFWFYSTRASEGIYRASRTGKTFTDPTRVLVGSGELPVASTRDGLTAYFALTKPEGLGAQDIYVGTRATTDALFGSFVHEAAISSSAVDNPEWLSADGCRLYFSSRISGTNDLYVAERAH